MMPGQREARDAMSTAAGVAIVAAVAAMTVGAAALLGRFLETLRAQPPEPFLGMAGRTAVAISLLGLALWLKLRPSARERLLGGIAAAGALVLAAGSVVEDLMIFRSLEAFLIDWREVPGGGHEPHTMALLTAVTLSMLAAALLLLDRETGRFRPARWLILAASAVAVLALIGHAYGVPAFYHYDDRNEMSALTAMATLTLSAGIFSARPGGLAAGFWNPTAEGRVVRRLLPFVVGAPVLVGWLRLMGEQAGLFGTAFGVAVFALSSIVYFLAMLIWVARSLRRSESALTRTQGALARSEQHLEATLSNVGDAVISTDVHGTIVRMNPIAEALTGWPLAEARGRDLDEVLQILEEGGAQPIRGIAQRVLRDGSVVNGNPRDLLQRRGGARLPITHRAGPIRNGENVREGTLVVFREASEERQAQAQLLVSDRLATVGTLAAGVAHEINNPLTSVMLNLSLAERRVGDLLRAGVAYAPGLELDLGEVEAQLRDAREGASRVRDIVRDIHLFSRAETPGTSAIDVRRVIESSLRVTANEVRHRARLVTELTEIPRVEANESRLGQVFVNLLVNAAQAIPEGHADRHVIRVATATDGAGRIVVQISDTGVGIAPEVMKRLFTPFFTTKPVGSGTGLGLSICQRLLADIGGTITLESSPGAGTVVRVVLPPAQVGDALAPAEAPEASRSARRGRILVIDDEPTIGLAIQRLLSADHDVDAVVSAADGLAHIRARAYDLVLCDVMMPVMTGMALHEELLRTAPQVARDMVFFSGGTFTPTSRAFLEGVPNRRLEKPFDIEELLDLADERVRAAKAAETSQAGERAGAPVPGQESGPSQESGPGYSSTVP